MSQRSHQGKNLLASEKLSQIFHKILLDIGCEEVPMIIPTSYWWNS